MAQKRNSAIIFIFITMLIDVIGFGIVIPVFPKLLTNLIHGNLSEASQYGGFLMFAYAFMQFFFSPIIGGLSDRFGRRPVILAALFGFAVDYVLTGFAPTIGWLFVGRILAGITGASFTVAGAYIADVSEPEKRAQNFGMIGAAFGLGFIIGPALGGLLGKLGTYLASTYPDSSFIGYDIHFWAVRLPFFASAFLALVNWLYGYFILPESLKVENRRDFDWKRANPIGSLKQLRKYPMLWGLTLPLLLIYVASYSQQSVWSFYTMEKFGWDEGLVGASLVAVGIAAAVVQGGLTRFILPKLGMNKSVYFGLALSTIAYLLYAIAWEGWMLFAIIAIASFGGISMPAMQGIMSNQVPSNEQGELRGALTSLMSLTAIIGPLIMTNLFTYFTSKNAIIQLPGAPFWASSLLLFLSIILTWNFLKDKESFKN
jgi:MFS transporter, DHA1 family, tetracycline resistance protein